MSSEDPKLDDGAKVCFLLILFGVWSFISLLMGPFGIPLLILAALFFVNAMKQKETKSTGSRDDLNHGTATGERPTIVQVDRRIVYQVPSKCPECGGSLRNEEVDWVGPLQAKCPFCRTTVEARPTEF